MSSGFRNMCFGPWAGPYEPDGQVVVTVHNYGFRKNLEWIESVQRFQKYAFRKVWIPLVPDLTSFWSMGKPYRANGQMIMELHNYRSRPFHRTSNGVNPSIGFRDMGSEKSGHKWYQNWQVGPVLVYSNYGTGTLNYPVRTSCCFMIYCKNPHTFCRDILLH